MDLEDFLPKGKHTLRVTFDVTVTVDEGKTITLAEAIDEYLAGASLIDWEVDGK